MARSPYDPYYTESIDIRPKPPKVEDKWDWNEFLGGLAKGAATGISLGIDLKSARDKASAARLAAMDLNPEPFLQEADRRFGVTPDDPTVGTLSPARALDVMETPTQGVDLMSVKEARDRDLARGRQVFSPEMRKELESVSDEELRLMQRKDTRRERETEAEDIRTLQNEYIKAVGTMNLLSEQRRAAQAKLAEADKTGNPELVEKAESQLEAVIDAIKKVELAGNMAEGALLEAGATKDDLVGLRDRDRRSQTMREMLRRLKGTTRTRRPGTR